MVKEFVPAFRTEFKEVEGKQVAIEVPVMNQLADGSFQQQWIEKEVQKQQLGIVNTAGADYICHHLEGFFNPQVAMADINSNREAAQIAADEALSIFSHIAYNAESYGVPHRVDNIGYEYYDLSPLENEFDSTMRFLYLYFTSLRAGGIREFGKVTTSSSYNANNNQTENENRSLFNLGKK